MNEWSDPMSKFSLMCLTAGLLFSGTAWWPTLAAEGTQQGASVPNFAPDGSTAFRCPKMLFDGDSIG
jgi:hypothetical protein